MHSVLGEIFERRGTGYETLHLDGRHAISDDNVRVSPKSTCAGGTKSSNKWPDTESDSCTRSEAHPDSQGGSAESAGNQGQYVAFAPIEDGTTPRSASTDGSSGEINAHAGAIPDP